MPTRDLGLIGGEPIITLKRDFPGGNAPAFMGAEVLPGRGMMLLQVSAHLPARGPFNILTAPPVERAREILSGGPDDFAGNQSFSMGAAILVPYANRIRGRRSNVERCVETEILGKPVILPANGGGKTPSAEVYAIHGLILADRVTQFTRRGTDQQDAVTAKFQAGDFGGHWLSSTDLAFEMALRNDSLSLTVTATNVGSEILPIGIGWHPYFALPSGRREQVRLHVPGRRRVAVNNYDEVLPTGELLAVVGTAYDFSSPAGAPLGNLYLDDCYVDLDKTAEGHTVAAIIDPEAGYGLRIVAASSEISAIQTYAPPERAFVVVEPQFNWADPFGSQWPPGTPTGMVKLKPKQSVTYAVKLELFTP
jgi:aldose 1-epimerase